MGSKSRVFEKLRDWKLKLESVSEFGVRVGFSQPGHVL